MIQGFPGGGVVKRLAVIGVRGCRAAHGLRTTANPMVKRRAE